MYLVGSFSLETLEDLLEDSFWDSFTGHVVTLETVRTQKLKDSWRLLLGCTHRLAYQIHFLRIFRYGSSVNYKPLFTPFEQDIKPLAVVYPPIIATVPVLVLQWKLNQRGFFEGYILDFSVVMRITTQTYNNLEHIINIKKEHFS